MFLVRSWNEKDDALEVKGREGEEIVRSFAQGKYLQEI
jgi:hypothetical protein